MQLTKEQIQSIPQLIEDGNTQVDIALYFGISRNAINRWIRILRKSGTKVNTKIGKPSTLRLKEPPCTKTTPQA